MQTYNNCHIYEVFYKDFEETKERMVTLFDYAQQKEVVVQNNDIRLKNALNMDIGDGIFFESRYHGWVWGRVVRITSSPSCRDEYMIRYYLEEDIGEDEDEIEKYYDEVDGNNIQYHR
jgi:hypothetical protein